VTDDARPCAEWRKSSYSGGGGQGGGNCVEIAPLSSRSIAVRNSRYPDGQVLHFARTELAAWIRGCKAGEFDEFVTE
jgi:hypothetical protein